MKVQQIFHRTIISKGLVAIVTAWNLQAAFALLIDPIGHLPQYLLGGQVGVIVLLSIAILFLMWNVPYLYLIFLKNGWQSLLKIILTMQAVGLLGELWILPLTLGLQPLRMTISRFIWFDLAGLILILGAILLNWKKDEHHDK